jgi:membrane-bound lytic murein transglycosylase D
MAAAEFDADHPRVNDFVTSFQARRASFQEALDRCGRYWGRVAVILAEEGLPIELAYLPLIESGYRTGAVSPAGAAGPWQFVAATGRAYGLRIDRYVDERRDPIRSTRAAARYLRDLHDMFGSWHLSLAAYNLGPARIARRLPSDGNRSFAGMVAAGSLPAETSNYVPQFLAAVRIAGAPEQHGFVRRQEQRFEYDTVLVRGGLGFRAIADLAGVSVAAIAELNPALLRQVTPPDLRRYAVRVPKGTKAGFALAYARLMDGGAPASDLLARARGDTSLAFRDTAVGPAAPPVCRPSGRPTDNRQMCRAAT